MMKKNATRSIVFTALLLALGLVLPFLTMQIPAIGQAISPLHIPALIAGLTVGPVYGGVMGLILPVLRSLLFGNPPLVPVAVPMCFELCAYAVLCGVLYPTMQRVLQKKSHLPAILCAMVIAMVIGRLAGGAVKAMVMGLSGKGFGFNAFLTSYFVGTAPGALIHLIVVPAVVLALEKAHLSPAEKH